MINKQESERERNKGESTQQPTTGFPIEGPGVHDDPADGRPVAPDPLGGALHHDVGAVRDGLADGPAGAELCVCVLKRERYESQTEGKTESETHARTIATEMRERHMHNRWGRHYPTHRVVDDEGDAVLLGEGLELREARYVVLLCRSVLVEG